MMNGYMSSVTMPKFWIADRMVTEGEYAAIMGFDVREGRKADYICSSLAV
jgi:formylglycine-generating enzyme required for sulfatase activity